MNLHRFARYAWAVLGYNLVVIVWGAYVRASGSGAGCGSHWPLCNGTVIPRAPQLATIIELTHRVTSGIALLMVLGLVFWAFHSAPRHHRVRKGALASLFFILTEALIGAGLVLFEYVAQNASIARAYWMAGHLINTFLLLGALTLTARWASEKEEAGTAARSAVDWTYWLGFIGLILLGVSGAIAALGDTLFPAGSLAEGFRQDFSPTAHFLERLRIWHPIIAVTVGAGLVAIAIYARIQRPSPEVKRWSAILIALVVTQLSAGLINLLLLAPIWMQLVHLLLSDLIWIALVLLAVTSQREVVRSETARAAVPAPSV